MLSALTACGAPAYTYAIDNNDQAYFKVPSGWPQVSARTVSDFQALLANTGAGTAGGKFTWTRAYDAGADPSPRALLAGSPTPVVYASVHDLKPDLRQALSFNEMRDLVFPVTPGARQQAAASGNALPGFASFVSSTITAKGGVRGINEVFGFVAGGLPVVFDQTVLTNSSTTKLYLLMVQCDLQCFTSNKSQIATVVQSFTVRGS
jgi:hypothetical protein